MKTDTETEYEHIVLLCNKKKRCSYVSISFFNDSHNRKTAHNASFSTFLSYFLLN